MKSKTSYFNKTIFKKNFTHYWPIWGMILFWNLFLLPFMIYDNSLQYRYYTNMTQTQIEQQRLHDITSLLQVYISPGMLFVFSLAAVMAVFSYLYSTRSAYTFHALPVTRLELFVTNYISGFLFLVIPEVVGFLTGTLVSVVCGYTSINYLFTGMLFAVGISFFFYTFTVFVAMFTGQLFAVPVLTLILNVLFVGSKFLVSAMVEMLSYGVSWGYSSSRMDVLSPLVYLLRNTGIRFDYMDDSTVTSGFEGTGAVAGYAFAALFLLAAAYYVYKKKHVETAGSLISVSWISPVFRWGAGLCGGFLFSMAFCSMLGIGSGRKLFFAVLAFAVLFGAVFFFGAQMFLEKGFRVFRKKRLAEYGIFSAALFLLLLSIECDFFGQEKKMPDSAEIESAYLSGTYVIGGDSEEDIRRILEIHSQIISSKKEFESFAAKRNLWMDSDLLGVTVNYYLKNGSMLRRAYNIPAGTEMISDPETVIGKLAEACMDPEVYLDNMFAGDYENVMIKDARMDIYDKDGAYDERVFSEEEAKKIYQAVIDDAMEGNFKEFVRNGLRYQDMEETADEVYYNSLTIQYVIKNDKIGNREARNREYNMWSAEGSAAISLHKNCRNTIHALIEAGVIKSEDDLYTRDEMETITTNADAVDAEFAK